MRTGRRTAFTLVELLVVIGIIAVLISILLPGLNRARQQANLIACQANLRGIGQLIQVYASANKGYAPPQWNGTYYTTIADVLTLMNNGKARQTPLPGYPAGSEAFTPVQTSPVFRDVDVDNQNWFEHSTAYMCNVRVFGVIGNQPSPTGYWDGEVGSAGPNAYRMRSYSKTKRPSEVMAMWDGPVNLAAGDGINYGVYTTFTTAIDNYGLYNSHGMRYPNPLNAAYNTAWYNNPISIGGPTGAAATGSSQAAGSVTKAYLKVANTDLLTFTYGVVGGMDANNMRFRHMGDTATNALFADGHVESRKLGEVLARDICVNSR